MRLYEVVRGAAASVPNGAKETALGSPMAFVGVKVLVLGLPLDQWAAILSCLYGLMLCAYTFRTKIWPWIRRRKDGRP